MLIEGAHACACRGMLCALIVCLSSVCPRSTPALPPPPSRRPPRTHMQASTPNRHHRNRVRANRRRRWRVPRARRRHSSGSTRRCPPAPRQLPQHLPRPLVPRRGRASLSNSIPRREPAAAAAVAAGRLPFLSATTEAVAVVAAEEQTRVSGRHPSLRITLRAAASLLATPTAPAAPPRSRRRRRPPSRPAAPRPTAVASGRQPASPLPQGARAISCSADSGHTSSIPSVRLVQILLACLLFDSANNNKSTSPKAKNSSPCMHVRCCHQSAEDDQQVDQPRLRQ
jgi:hypothetical protein